MNGAGSAHAHTRLARNLGTRTRSARARALVDLAHYMWSDFAKNETKTILLTFSFFFFF